MSKPAYPIISINVSTPIQISYRNKPLETGIYKKPAVLPIQLNRHNFVGDGQADLVNHGGADKAVCVYSFAHFPYWEEYLGKRLQPGAFGENLTVDALQEQDVCIGDIFKLGETLVQISQPRQPCYKLAHKHVNPDMVQLVQQSGKTGFYLRVLQEGIVSAGDQLTLYERHPKGITVTFANHIKYIDKSNFEAIHAILEVDALSSSWRESFEGRLE